MKPGKVHAALAENYPKALLTWVRSAKWKRARVPLARIQMDARPGRPHDPRKVAKIRAKIRAGQDPRPVALVNTGKGKLKIADGYHRTAALALEGRTHTDAYVGKLRRRVGPWSRALHDAKRNV